MINVDILKSLLSNFSTSLSNYQDDYYKILDKSDKIIVWLVGFSIALIALSIDKKDELDLVINNLSGYILLFGALTVIFGVFHRIFSFLSQLIFVKTLFKFRADITATQNSKLQDWLDDKSQEKEISTTLDKYADIISHYFGYSKRKLLKKMSERVDNLKEEDSKWKTIWKRFRIRQTTLLWIFGRLADAFFILSCATFGIGMCVVLIKYFE